MGIILPGSTLDATITMAAQTEAPVDMICKDKFLVQSFVAWDGATAKDITPEMFEKSQGKAIEEFKMRVFFIPANPPSVVQKETEEGSSQSLEDRKESPPMSSTSLEHSLTSSEASSIKLFTIYNIESATNGLSESSKIGQGGYGVVYRGYLDNADVAIKMLDPNGQQGITEFLQEMEVLGQMRHPNLIKLIGACFKLRSLVYEFLPNGSVGDCLKNNPRLLTWQMRTRIIYEICSALIFLHSNKPQPLVHGDLKPAKILLDANFVSKLADFGLCRFLPEGTTTVAFLDTTPKGTLGYIDPEFLKTGILTPSCDVYSFGVTIMKLLTGMETLGIGTKVRTAYKEKSVGTMVDPTAGRWPADVSEFLAYFGLKCCARKKSS